MANEARINFGNTDIAIDTGSGVIAEHADCCCNEGWGDGCCDPETPRYVQVIITGVSNCGTTDFVCDDCDDCSCVDVNATWIVENCGSDGSAQCLWAYKENCCIRTSPPATQTIGVSVTSSGVTAGAQLNQTDPCAGGIANCFGGAYTSGGVCDYPASVSSTISCSGSTNCNRGSSGTATVTAA